MKLSVDSMIYGIPKAHRCFKISGFVAKLFYISM